MEDRGERKVRPWVMDRIRELIETELIDRAACDRQRRDDRYDEPQRDERYNDHYDDRSDERRGDRRRDDRRDELRWGDGPAGRYDEHRRGDARRVHQRDRYDDRYEKGPARREERRDDRSREERRDDRGRDERRDERRHNPGREERRDDRGRDDRGRDERGRDEGRYHPGRDERRDDRSRDERRYNPGRDERGRDERSRDERRDYHHPRNASAGYTGRSHEAPGQHGSVGQPAPQLRDNASASAALAPALDFKEFCEHVRDREQAMHTDEELKARFDSLDADESGKVNVAYMVWSQPLDNVVANSITIRQTTAPSGIITLYDVSITVSSYNASKGEYEVRPLSKGARRRIFEQELSPAIHGHLLETSAPFQNQLLYDGSALLNTLSPMRLERANGIDAQAAGWSMPGPEEVQWILPNGQPGGEGTHRRDRLEVTIKATKMTIDMSQPLECLFAAQCEPTAPVRARLASRHTAHPLSCLEPSLRVC